MTLVFGIAVGVALVGGGSVARAYCLHDCPDPDEFYACVSHCDCLICKAGTRICLNCNFFECNCAGCPLGCKSEALSDETTPSSEAPASDDVYKQVDADGNLEVSFDEFMRWADDHRDDVSARMFSEEDRTFTESNIRQLFHDLDADEDEAITVTEAGCEPESVGDGG